MLSAALRREPHDDAAVGELAVPGAVEVDDVQPVSAQRAITQQQLVRLEVVARFRVEVALAAGARSGRRADRWRE